MALPMQPYLLQQWNIIWVFVSLALPLIFSDSETAHEMGVFIQSTSNMGVF